MSWSSYQTAIFDEVARGSGNIVVVARAGTGKSTLIEEITKRLPTGVSVLVLAFNADIAKELDGRVRKGCDVMTCNGLGHRAVMRAYGSKRPTNESRIREILRRDEFFPSRSNIRSEIARIVSRSKNTMMDSRQGLSIVIDRLRIDPRIILDESDRMIGSEEDQILEGKRQLIGWVMQAMSVSLREIESHAEIDFDDQLWITEKQRLPLGSWDYVLADEIQDFNMAQISMIQRLGGRFIGVGDPRQAIYSFRGADPQAFDRIIQMMKAKVFHLPRTYRCGKAIVEMAKKFVPDFEADDSNQQGEISTYKSLPHRELRPGDFVISRKNSPLIAHALKTISVGTPARILGRELGRDLSKIVSSVAEKPGDSFKNLIRMFQKQIEMAISHDDLDLVEDLSDKLNCLRTLFMENDGDASKVLRLLEFLCVDKKEKVVLFMSAHRSKGLETDRVFLLDSTFKDTHTEEENLRYVAITRAKANLFIVEKED